jgi:surfeit locus 1 family protein
VLALGGEKDNLEYRRVRVVGRFLHEKELHLRAIENGKPGWHVLTPLETEKGVVLVNRGFVAVGLKDRSKRMAGLPPGPVTLTGLVRVPAAERGSFVPENRPEANEWYWIDLPAMRKAAALDGISLPFVLATERLEGPVPPLGGATHLELPNRHLEYALTWYALAFALLSVYASYMINMLKSNTKK